MLGIDHISQMPPEMVAKLLVNSDDWHQRRQQGIGGSDAVIIAHGDDDKLEKLWLEKTGQIDPENLDDIVCVQIGKWTEPLNRLFFERQLNTKVQEINAESRIHPLFPFIRANLDGMAFVNGVLCVLECKHLLGFQDFEEAAAKYYPQIQHNLLLTGCKTAYLSAFEGMTRYKYLKIASDPDYQNDLLSRETEFWECVTHKIKPTPSPMPEVIPGLDDMRSVDMTGSNAWANAATDWLENQQAAKKFENAKKSLKDLVAPDVKLASGAGIQIKRAQNKSLRISKMKDT